MNQRLIRWMGAWLATAALVAGCGAAPVQAGDAKPPSLAAQVAPVKTEAPAAAPAPAPVAAAEVTVVKAPGTVGRNATASVTAKAAPGAACSIVVMYKSGPSKAQGLGAKQAGADGLVGWSWKVGGNTTRGTWPVTITCNGQRAQTAVTVP